MAKPDHTPPSTNISCFILAGVLLMSAAAMQWEAAAAIGIGVLLVAWLAEGLFFSKGSVLAWVASSVQPMIWVFLGTCALQLVPLPAGLLEELSPAVFADKSEAFLILSGGKPLVRVAAAYAPAKAAVKLAFLAAAAAAFFLVLNTLTGKTRITFAVSAVVGLGAIEALMVLGRVISGNLDPSGDVFAAGVLAGSLPAAVGLYLSLEQRSERLEPGLDGTRAGVQRMVGKVAPESVRPAGVVLVLSTVLIAAALYFCAATVARFASGLSLFAAAILFFAGKRNRKGGLAFLVLALFFLFTLGLGPADAPGASKSARSVSAAAKDYPLMGLGLGSFRDLYPRYAEKIAKQIQKSGKRKEQKGGDEGFKPPATRHLPQPSFGAELAAETGVLAFAVLLFAAGYVVFRIGKIRYRRRDRHAAAVGTGAGAGFLALVLLGLTGPHSLAFSHLLYGAVLAAAGKAAVFRRGRGPRERFFFDTNSIPLKGTVRFMVFLPALTLVAVVAAPMAETFKAGPGKEKFAGSAVVQPPAASIEQSLLANPAQPISWLNLGRIYASRRSDPLAFLNTWLPRADGCYLQAVSYAPFEPGVLFSAAGHFVERAATLAEEAGEGRGETIARFQEYYRRALAADPGLWQEAADRIWMFFPEERVVMGIVPEGMAELRDRVLRYVVRKGSE